jgi:nucleotide-binding universal stress UspA family protein
MTYIHMHVTSRRHRQPKLNLLGRSRAFEPRDDTSARVEFKKADGPWKGHEIMVPITFHAASEYAVEVAIDMAKMTGSGLLLVHVADHAYGKGFLASKKRESGDLKFIEAPAERLAKLAGTRRNENVPIRWVVKTGHPAYQILRLAETENARVIVLARTPRNVISRMIVGSVSSDIVDCSPCPVLVINSFARGTKE